MSKRLILILALAFVVGITCAAYAEVQNVKVSGDITALGVDRQGFNLGNQSLSGYADNRVNASVLASIVRLRVDADLTDNVATTVRLLNERPWGTLDEPAAGHNPNTEIDLDLAYVALKEFLYSPLTLILGRQPLRLGNGLLLGDADTNRLVGPASALDATGLEDLSARKAFDAIVGVLDYSPLKVTGAFAKGYEGDVNDHIQDDVDVWALQAAYDTGVKNTVGELTYALKKGNTSSLKAEVHNISARIVSTPIENLTADAEFVYQAQKGIRDAAVNSKMASDTAIVLSATYAMPKVKMSPSIGLDYTRLSHNWNVMFEDVIPADIANAILPNTNMQVIGAKLSVKPIDDLTVKLRYANLALANAKNGLRSIPVWPTVAGTTYYSLVSGKKALGNEVDLHLLYDYTEDVQLGLLLGVFEPSSAFDKDNRQNATQVIGSMKVTF